MKLETFVKKNRKAIDEVIKRECSNCNVFNDAERRLWVLNNEGLYLWALDCGVDFDK